MKDIKIAQALKHQTQCLKSCFDVEESEYSRIQNISKGIAEFMIYKAKKSMTSNFIKRNPMLVFALCLCISDGMVYDLNSDVPRGFHTLLRPSVWCSDQWIDPFEY